MTSPRPFSLANSRIDAKKRLPMRTPFRCGPFPLVVLAIAVGGNGVAAGQDDGSRPADASSGRTGNPAAEASPPDEVWIAPGPDRGSGTGWYPDPIVRRRVRIVEFGPRAFRFVPADRPGVDAADGGGSAGEEQIASSRVLWVARGTASPFETRGLRLFAEKRYAEALPVLIDAIGTRPPAWHQQWLSMVAAQAAWRGGRPEVALELVNQLDRLPFSPLTLAWMPIAWHTSAVDRDDVRVASERLRDGSPAVQLVASSWILATRRGEAAQRLRVLAAERSRPQIAKLASFVGRRAAAPPEVESFADRWLEEVEAMPMVLRVGPTVMMIHKLEAAGERGRAGRLRRGLVLTPPHPHPDIPERSEPIRKGGTPSPGTSR